MHITSSANLRKNYRKEANRCKETGEPTFLTTNGEGDLVLLSIDAYKNLISHRAIETELVRIEAEEKAGRIVYMPFSDFEKESKKALRSAESGEDKNDHE